MTLLEEKIGRDQRLDSYFEHWGLKEDPFRPELKSAEMFVAAQKDDLRRLKWVMSGGKLGVLTGGLGSGKTATCEFLVALLRENSLTTTDPSKMAVPVLIHGAAYKSIDEVLRAIILTLEMDAANDHTGLFEILRKWPQEHPERLAIIMDDAHESGADVKEMGEFFRVLVDIPNITILLNGEPKQMKRFLKEIPALEDRVQTYVEVKPMDRKSLLKLLKLRLKNAGCTKWNKLLTEKGFNAIYKLSKGVPRQALKLTSNALRHAAREGTPINARAVKKGNNISFFRSLF